MIKPNTIFFDGRKIGTYKYVLTAGTGHINFDGFEPCGPQLEEETSEKLSHVHVVTYEYWSDRLIKGIYSNHSDAVKYVTDKGFTAETAGGWVRPYGKQRGYDETEIYYIEKWRVW